MVCVPCTTECSAIHKLRNSKSGAPAAITNQSLISIPIPSSIQGVVKFNSHVTRRVRDLLYASSVPPIYQINRQHVLHDPLAGSSMRRSAHCDQVIPLPRPERRPESSVADGGVRLPGVTTRQLLSLQPLHLVRSDERTLRFFGAFGAQHTSPCRLPGCHAKERRARLQHEQAIRVPASSCLVIKPASIGRTYLSVPSCRARYSERMGA